MSVPVIPNLNLEIKPAIKHKAKGRIALVGPGGSGKSLTALRIARLLAGAQGRILAVDTEKGTLSKYAVSKRQPEPDNQFVFAFDVIELRDSYSIGHWRACHQKATQNKYDVMLTDSFSHFWFGKGGALEFVDEKTKAAKAAKRDNMDGWKELKPHETAMLEELTGSPCHIICTMRTKNEYEQVKDPTTGRMKREKVGLAPVQRENFDYEFDLVLYMTPDNEAVVEKTRCNYYRGKVLAMPTAEDFIPFMEWLEGDEYEAPEQRQPEQEQVERIGPQPVPCAAANKPWQNFGQMRQVFAELQRRIPANDFAHMLRAHGVESPDKFKSTDDALACYADMRGWLDRKDQAA